MSDPQSIFCAVGVVHIDERDIVLERGSDLLQSLLHNAKRQAFKKLLQELGIDAQYSFRPDAENRRVTVTCRFVRTGESIDLATDFAAID